MAAATGDVRVLAMAVDTEPRIRTPSPIMSTDRAAQLRPRSARVAAVALQTRATARFALTDVIWVRMIPASQTGLRSGWIPRDSSPDAAHSPS
jgi:hypothetical protein